MDPKLWLLIEWVEDKSAFSNYGIINKNTLIQHEIDLHNGKVVLVRDKNNGTRKAQILRISDNKRYLKDFKVMLERQDNQVKNVVSLCMNTIKEMKTGQMLLDSNEGRTLSILNRTNKLPEQEMSSTDSDSDEEDHRNLNLTKSAIKHSNYQSRRPDSVPTGQISRLLNDKTLFNNHKPLKSSTPLPERHVNENHTLTYDQGTQTDPSLYPPANTIEQLETVLRRLYGQFLSLIADVQLQESNCLDARRSEEQIYSEGNVTAITEPQYSNADFEMDKRNKSKALQVRRASAQTTNTGLLMVENNADMVSIGSGNVTVPARLWTNMDWTSHTSATRQLLQAVFPRRILATHSLTGKQSPAFIDKPPKQQLDPKLVDDIVCTVSERCGVPKRIVRSSITTKCTDEAKLYRNRLQQRKREQHNPENISPLPSSNESSNARD